MAANENLIARLLNNFDWKLANGEKGLGYARIGSKKESDVICLNGMRSWSVRGSLFSRLRVLSKTLVCLSSYLMFIGRIKNTPCHASMNTEFIEHSKHTKS